MLEVVGRTLQAAVSLIDVRAKLLLHDAEQAAAAMLLKAAGGVCLGLAVFVGITAGVIALAPVWGWPGALGAAAGLLAVVGLIAWIVAASVKEPKKDPVAEDLELQAARLRAQLHPPEVKVIPASTSRGALPPPRAHQDPIRAVQQMIKDPAMIASAVFAVVAVLGPLRAIRTAAKVAAAASAARRLANAVRESPLGQRS